MRTLYWKSLLYEYTKKKGSKRANVQTFLPKKQEIFRVFVHPCSQQQNIWRGLLRAETF